MILKKPLRYSRPAQTKMERLYIPLIKAEQHQKDFRQYRTIAKRRKMWYNRNMETQLTLAMMNDELGQARTSKKEFLDKIE
ncbi:MAG: hypothetical protein MR836_08915, partial [Ruminococcus sp.]|nr:hypothetical protein [Ruminococcus sp.]